MLTVVYGDRIRSARTLRRLKSADVAAELGWPASRQTRLEQSETVQLDDAQLTLLGKLLDFPEKFFRTPPPGPVTADDLLFRAPVSTTKGEKAYLAEFARTAGEVLEWLDQHHRLPPVRIPTLSPRTQVAAAAVEVRQSLGVAVDQPIDHLTHRAERAGVPVIMRGALGHLSLHRDEDSVPDVFIERHLGYSTRVGEHADRPVTVLRANPSWERIRWTVAHELGHITLHGGTQPANSEKQASLFASELLAPAKTIQDELPKHVTLASLTGMKLRWGISLGALIIHLRDNGLIDAERFGTLRRQLYTRTNSSTGRTWGRDEPGWDAREVERPRLLATWLERCIGVTAPHAVAQISGMWPADILGSMVSGQRGKSETTPSRRFHETEASKGDVVSLKEWRLRQA